MSLESNQISLHAFAVLHLQLKGSLVTQNVQAISMRVNRTTVLQFDWNYETKKWGNGLQDALDTGYSVSANKWCQSRRLNGKASVPDTSAAAAICRHHSISHFEILSSSPQAAMRSMLFASARVNSDADYLVFLYLFIYTCLFVNCIVIFVRYLACMFCW